MEIEEKSKLPSGNKGKLHNVVVDSFVYNFAIHNAHITSFPVFYRKLVAHVPNIYSPGLMAITYRR